jgi:Tfp pilus assembly protein PilX
MRKPQKQFGYILILGIVVMAILMTMSGVVWGYTTMQVKSSKVAIGQTQALHVAEAGIDKALNELNLDSSFNGESDVTVGPGEYTTTVSTIDANNKQIVSTGYVPNNANPISQATVKVKVSIDLSSVSFNFGVQVGEGGLTMGNNSAISGNVYSNGNVSGSGNITGDVTVAGGGSAVLDQQCATNSGSYDFNTTAKRDVAQKFTPTVSTQLTRVSVYIKKTGSPSNITVRVVTDNNGSPSTTVVGGTGTIASSSVTGSYGWIDATFSSNPALTSGTNYWLLLDTSSSTTNYYSWATDSNDTCSNGTSKSTSNWSSPSWAAISKDMNFRVYMGGQLTSLSGVSVGGDLRANSMTGCNVGGDAYYNTTNTCSVAGSTNPGTADSPQQAMPISQAQIDEWKAAAESGGTHNGNLTYTNGQTATIGPLRINGNLTLDNNVTVYLTGPIWVNGNISISNNSIIRIDNSIGGSGVAIIADGTSDSGSLGRISIGNNADIVGNNSPGSYPLVLSTNNSTTAITLSNNTAGAIYYAANGTIVVSNNAGAYQLTGYAISLSNNSTITYQSGLASVTFSNGPGGSWAIVAGSYLIVE